MPTKNASGILLTIAGVEIPKRLKSNIMIPTARSHAPMNMNKNNVSDSLGIALRNSSVSYI